MSTKSRLISGRVPVSNSANVTSERYQYLDLSSAEPNLGTSSVGDVLTYDSSYPGGRRWIPQSDIRGSIGQAAYIQANTASANTLYISGVDITQNNRISTLETVNGEQNTSISIIQGVNVTQNTNITNVDTKAQAAFDKANTGLASSGGSITGSLSVSQNLTVTGNLTVLGNSTTLTTNTLDIGDSLIYLANNNLTSDAVDIGIIGHYNDGANAHAGIIRDPNAKEWIFFKGYTPEVQSNNLIDINHASFAKANVQASYFKGNVVFSDGTTQTSAATNIDSYARAVNDLQNTNVTAVNTYAAGAYGAANTNATNITIIQGVDVGQNTRMSIIEGVDVTQNTNITAAFNQANSANVLAQSAFDKANTALSNTNLNVSGTLRMLNQGGDEGGELFLDKPATSTSLAAGITIDIFQNKLRFFETGGSVRGVFIDMANGASAGVGTDLLNPASAPDAVARATASAAFDKANSANVLAQAAFDKANTASSNTIIIQGVDTTQNTRMTVIEGVDLTQNTNITNVDTKSQSAFNKANSANVLAQAAFDYANTILSLDNNIDSVARTTANNASSNTIVIQGVDTWQNTQITAASSLAQGAFARANSGARATTSNTAPTGNTVGDLWLSLTDETLYMYSYDGTSNNWVDISGPILRSSNIVVQYTITANVS